MDLPKEVLDLKHRKIKKIFITLLLQNLAQMLEIWYVALPNVLFLCLSK